ncbi:MAG: TerB N-terminal domain-containing protein [Thermoanaerobaculia bacterium]
MTPQFVVDVSAARTTYRNRDAHGSIDELVAAIRQAATYKSSVIWIFFVVAIAAVFAFAIRPWLCIAVAIIGVVVLAQSHARAALRRRVAVVYHLDSAAGRAYHSLTNGVGWLGSSHSVWRVNGWSGRGLVRITRGVPYVLTNIGVPSIVSGNETLLFFPDALIVRDHASNFIDVPYSSVRVKCETTRVSESQPPADSRQVGRTWLHTNKDGGPDRRRSPNPSIAIVEYAQVELSWRGTSHELLISNVEAAQHFVDAMRTLTPSPTPEVNVPIPTSQREPTPPTDLERALQASIDRRRRLDELEQQALATVTRITTRQSEEPTVRMPAKADWITPGATAAVHGYATGDLVYVGSRLPALNGDAVESSLINPDLPIDPQHANSAGGGIDYWPSYSEISAASRTAYLQWLGGGRKDPQVFIGYVFVFFYGLERRVYELIKHRGTGTDEALAIARELARLLELHARRSHSFAAYGDALLDLLASIEPRAQSIPRHEPIRPGYGVPMRLKIALGERVAAGKPIPGALALDWVRSTYFLTTPATRCANEFELLFHVRYAKQFGDGMLIKPNKTFVDVAYRPASSALDVLIIKRPDLPDVTQLERPMAKLIELTRECSSALDPFSRFLGKNANARDSLAAFALLPDELVEATPSTDAKSLSSLVASRLGADGWAHLGAAELLQYVRLAKADKVSKNEAMLLAQALERIGYGIEPDVRLGGPVFDLDGPVVVFRRHADCPSVASQEYSAATLLIRLAAIVSAADDAVSEIERKLLERHIEERLQLTPGERQRLAAHLTWLIDADLGMTGLKRRIESLPTHARRSIGTLLVDVAATDGQVDAREMKILEKLYSLLELPSADLYRDVHSAHAIDDEPIVVDQPESVPKGFAIPPKPSPVATTAAGLDMSRVRLKIAETREVSALLSSIFVEEEASPVTAPAADPLAGTIGSLDTAHSELLRRLAERESWPRDEVERIAAELSLLPDGALETINDYAYATLDQPFWEDDDPLAINSNAAMELTR